MKLVLCIATALATASLTACAQSPQPDDDSSQASATAAPAPGATGEAPVTPAAPADTPDGRARQAVQQLNPQLTVDYVGEAPLPGFREVIVGGQLVYISDDGRFLVQGTVVDIATQQELTQSSGALSTYRQQLLGSAEKSQRIVFAPPNPDYTISVFTDIECGYCRKMHGEIAEYNRLGIAVEYLAFPRMGPGSQDHTDMISVWCAPDRRRAMTEAKAGKPVMARTCTSSVDMHYNLGLRLGVTGTPAIFAPNGTQLGGYVPPAQLREALDGLAAKTGGNAAGQP